MRPLLVLLLVIVALGAFFLAMNFGETEEGPGSVDMPDTAKAGQEPGEEILQIERPGVGREPLDEKTSPEEAPPRPIPEQNLVLSKVLHGRVQLSDGTPVENAQITLSTGVDLFTPTPEERANDRSAATGARGRFAFEGVDPFTDYTVTAMHPDHGRREETHVRAGASADAGLVITLMEGARLFGLVTDSSGQGVPATLYLGPSSLGYQAEESGPNTVTVQADQDGVYQFRNVSPGNYSLSVVAEGFGRVTIQQLNVTGTEDLQRDITLEVAYMIGGVVNSSSGGPIAGATVKAWSTTSRKEQTHSVVKTNAQGEFVFADVRQGSYTLIYNAPRHIPGRSLRVKTGSMNESVVLKRKPTISGTALDPSGSPLRNFEAQLRIFQTSFKKTIAVPGTRVRVKGSRTGEFEIVCPKSGEYYVEVRHRTFSPTYSELIILAEEQELDGVIVQMQEGGGIRGRIIDSDGRPVAGARIQTHPTDYVDDEFQRMLGEVAEETERTVSSDAEGDFEVTGLRAGVYQIDVRHGDYSGSIVHQITVDEGRVAEVADVRLRSGAAISGTVLGPAGKGLAGAVVVLRLAQGNTDQDIPAVHTARANDAGEYTFLHIPAASYDIYVQRQANENPFQVNTDMRNTKRRIVLSDGQKLTEAFHLPN